MSFEAEFEDITLEDLTGKSNVKEKQYQDMLQNIGIIMTNINGFPEELNKEVWDNKPYDEQYDYLELNHEDITTLNTTKSLLKNILFKLEKDEDRVDFYGGVLSYYYNITEEEAKEDILSNRATHTEDEGYKYILKIINYKENNKGVPEKDE